MKTEILSDEKSQSIDWSKVQLVTNNKGCIVLTNGRYGLGTFEGVVVYSEYDTWKICEFSTAWVKSFFNPLPSPVTIKFEF